MPDEAAVPDDAATPGDAAVPEGESIPGEVSVPDDASVLNDPFVKFSAYDSDDRSGGGQVVFAYVSDAGITVEWCAESVSADTAGAVVTFSGVVRNHDHGRAVTRLSYTSHPSAGTIMRDVANDIALAHPTVKLAVAHRIGNLAIGDIALACAVSAPHRGEAFAACSELVDAVKARVPIWKEQWFSDGTVEWVGAVPI